MRTRSSPTAHLLIVEEDEEIRDFLLVLLAQEHYRCAAAASFEEALALLEERRFDVILAELLQARPGDLFRSARRFQFLAEPTPIALLTGWNVTQEEATGLGFVGLLSKPFDVDDLLAWLDDLVRQFTFHEAAACVRERAELGS
ncbi:MAG TPA: response regulator [Ktedonobacterales bacterium]